MDRLERLRRLHRLEEKMRDAANWRLAALARERDDLEAARRAMLAAAAGEFSSFGPLAVAVARRIRAIEQKLEAAIRAYDEQQMRAAEAASRAKMTGNVRAQAEASAHAERMRDDLADLIEAAVAARASRFAQG